MKAIPICVGRDPGNARVSYFPSDSYNPRGGGSGSALTHSQPRIAKQDHGYGATLYGIAHNVNWIFFQFDDAEARFVDIVASRREKRGMRF
ncbi:MAG: hypothetical protein ACLPGW_19070 [Roseiarcus sp.]